MHGAASRPLRAAAASECSLGHHRGARGFLTGASIPPPRASREPGGPLAQLGWRGRRQRPGGPQQQRGARRLAEVEVARQVTQLGRCFAHVRARIGTPVGGGIEAPAAQEVVLDELRVRVEAERLVVDVAALGVGADHQSRNT